MISDLKVELSIIGSFDGMKEKGAGVYYYKSIPFLHFHNKDGKRWADVKTPKGFQPVAIDFGATAKERKSFLKFIENAYKVLTNGNGKK